ncbi:hypothetical protein GEMRC1_008764 [Eukaryota sp. GEM-RC1]
MQSSNACSGDAQNSCKNPVVLIPGAAGSILKARSKSDPTNDFIVWPRLNSAMYLEKFCWIVPESELSTSVNDVNVDFEIYVPMDDFGLFALSDLGRGIYSGDLPRFFRKFTGYFISIIELLEEHGYQRGVDLLVSLTIGEEVY